MIRATDFKRVNLAVDAGDGRFKKAYEAKRPTQVGIAENDTESENSL